MNNKQKETIAKDLKNITLEEAINDFIKLQNINLEETTALSRVGLKFIDYFMYHIRLDTVGNKGISFFTFVEDFEEYRTKWKCIRRLYDSLREKHPSNFYKCAKEIFQLYFGSINAFRPVVAMKIYDRYKPTNVLNVCSGWSGFILAAAAMNIKNITAIDNNPLLLKPNQNIIKELAKYSSTEITFINDNVLTTDISSNFYDMIISSPPYYNKEIYGYLPQPYDTKLEWEQSFYIPLFKKLYNILQINGKLIINVPIEIYEKCLVPLFGEANELILLPKYQRNNKYKEYIYVWIKVD